MHHAAQTYRLNVAAGHAEVINGEIPAGLLRACRDLAAEHLDGKGVIVFQEHSESPSITFHGDFSAQFQQKLRNIWGITLRGQKVPERLGPPLPIFQVSVSAGTVYSVRGSTPDVVMKFCEAFARANQAAVVRVTGLLEGEQVRLQVMGDMAKPLQEKLRRRWETHQKEAPPVIPRLERPKGRRGPKRLRGKWIAGAVWAGLLLVVFLTGNLPGRLNQSRPGRDSSHLGVPSPFAMPGLGFEEPPLANGEVTEKIGPLGPHTFYVDNRESRGFLARLIQRDGLVRRAFYVGPSQRAEIHGVPDGAYDVAFIQGRSFSKATGQFHSGLSVSRLGEVFEYRTEPIPGGTRFWTKGIVTHAPQGRIRRYPAPSDWARR